MAGVTKATFDSPTETRPFKDGKGQVDLLETETGVIGRARFEPGWRWSQHVQPIVGGDSCQARHVGYFLQGRMTIRMDDGTETQIGPGEVHDIPAGHDAWVDGDEAVVAVDWSGYKDYAKPQS